MVYDVRNNRDTAHLGDGIDPNTQDATLVISCIDWVLAEFFRLKHGVPANKAQELVDAIVSRKAPVVQEFDGFPKVLDPALGASDHCLVLLYHRGSAGAPFEELSRWVRPKMRANLKRTLNRLVVDKDLVHDDGSIYVITRLGEQEVEGRRLVN